MITFPRSERCAILKRPEFRTKTLASCPTMRTVGTKEAELTLRPQELRAVALIAITTALTTERGGGHRSRNWGHDWRSGRSVGRAGLASHPRLRAGGCRGLACLHRTWCLGWGHYRRGHRCP